MDTSSPPPATLGKYQVRGVLGRGAMGTVYDGWDPLIGRRVAIKTVRLLDQTDPETQEALARFQREAQAAGRLSHPNIVGVYDYGETSEAAFIVMEFVEGQSLKERLDEGDRLPLAEMARIMEQVLAALQFSHERGVIHRDIKPGNVMIAKDGQVKLADFGIARIESSVMTQDGTMLGTPAYMSPEQLMAQSVDSRSDIYSAGVLLYQLLTGERPYEGGLTAIILKVFNTVPPRPSEISATAPPAVDAVVERAMARPPDDRYPSATAFAQALREAVRSAEGALPGIGPRQDDATLITQPARRAAPATAPAPAMPVAAPRDAPRRGSPALFGGVAAAVLVLAGGGAWFALRPSTAELGSAARPAAPAPAAPAPAAPAPAAPAPAAPVPRATGASVAPTEPIQRPLPLQSSPPIAEAPPPPVAPPVPEPAPTRTALVTPNPAVVRDALATLGAAANCAVPRFGVSDEGRVDVTGLVGAGAPDAALREAVQAAAPGAALDWRLSVVDGPYCAALDVIRPLAQPGSPFLGLALKNEATHLKDNDPIQPILKLPEFPSHLQVDYLSHDGSVTHLFPLPGSADKTFAANATVPLGTVGTVGPPFGTDMIVAVASSAPLFAQRRPADGETVRTYLPVLQAAIDAALKRKAKVTGRALVLETVEK